MPVFAFLKKVAVVGLAAAATFLAGVSLAGAQSRTALVVGQGAYEGAQIPTAVNDAGLVAQALTSAGFEVIQGRDLGASDLRRIVRDFLDKVEAGGPDGEAMVYLSGHGVQLEGENYLIPVDARIARDSDIPIEGFRLSDLFRSLAAAPGRVRIVAVDLAHDYPLPTGGQSIARGLALIDPLPGFLVAFSSAPNIPVPEEKGPYGTYAPALVEMIREPGLPLEEVFARTRLRTHQVTDGQQVPWHVSDLKADFTFFEIEDTAATPAPAPAQRPQRRIADTPAVEAYSVAVERDTIEDYQEFLRSYPDHPEARRVAALLAARREAVIWRKTLSRNTSNAYWTYLRQYPRGPHAGDARRRLARLRAQFAPPVVFEEVIYEDLPPLLPIVETIEVVEVVTIIRRLPPPPPWPIFILPPRDEVVVVIISRPPPPPLMIGILPIPVAIPIHVHARRPRWYQPIAPITPRGPVLIPVAAPERLSREEFRERRERNRDRPFAPFLPRESTVPNQPGLAAPIVPIATRPPEADRTRDNRDRNRRDGNRDGRDGNRGPRLPLQPVPLGEGPTGAQLPGTVERTGPGDAPGRQGGENRDRDARRDGQDRDGRGTRGEQPGLTVPGQLAEPPGGGDRRQREERRARGQGDDQRQGAEQQGDQQDRRAREEAERQQGRALEQQQRRAVEEQQRQEQQQRRAVEEQQREQRRAAEQQQRRAVEEQQRQEQQQRRAVEEQQRQEQQQRRAVEEQQREQRRAAEQQQRRAVEEQQREQRRAAEQQQRRAVEEQQREQRRAAEQQQRRAVEEQQREQRRAAEQQQRRAIEEQQREQRRAAEQQQRRAIEDQARQQQRALEQQQRRAVEEQGRQQQRALEQQQRAVQQQQRGGGDEGGGRGRGGGGRKALECQLTGRC
jgi:uncharacterized caspase-like protein